MSLSEVTVHCSSNSALASAPRATRGMQIDNRFRRIRAERHALVDRGQKTRRPVNRPARWQTAGIGQDHKGGQVFVDGSQAVAGPRAHAGEPIHREPGVHLKRRGGVVVALGDHRMEERDVIDTFRQVWKKTADPMPAPAMLRNAYGLFITNPAGQRTLCSRLCSPAIGHEMAGPACNRTCRYG